MAQGVSARTFVSAHPSSPYMHNIAATPAPPSPNMVGPGVRLGARSGPVHHYGARAGYRQPSRSPSVCGVVRGSPAAVFGTALAS